MRSCGTKISQAMVFWVSMLTAMVFTAVCCLTDAISVRIDVHPLKKSFNPGDNVTLTCLVEHGGPADVIHWYKDDQPISANSYSNSSQLAEISLLNFTKSDTGRYKCTAWKRQVKRTDFINLHMNAAPTLTPLKEEVGALLKQEKEITCEAEGWPPPLIKWIRESAEIKEGARVNYSIKLHPNKSQVTLIIRSFDEHHEGAYTCEASNVFGKTNQTIHLFTLEQPAPPRGPQIIVSSHHVFTSAGSNVTLVCDILYFRHHWGAWLWAFNGNSTILDERLPSPYYSQSVVEFHDRMLMVLDVINASERHNGLYECSIFQDRWFEKNNITLIVDEKDNVQNISTNLKTVQAAANTQVQLKCITSYSNFLEPEIFWTFQGEKLNETDSHYKTETYKLNSSELTCDEQMSLWIRNVSDPDFGCYSCALNSSMGLSSATIVLAQMKSEKDYSSEDTEESDSTALIVLFPVLAGGLFLTLTAAVFIRKLLKKRHEWKPEEAASDEEIKYDVFVTFSNKDSRWVTSNLTPLLERNCLKYCIHSRDFELGRALVDNMAESVYSSRKVLAVMSKNYMDSKFCRGELDMALHRSRGVHKGCLLIVRIDGIKKKKLPKALREQTFVDYHSDKERTVWEKKLLRFLVETEVDQNRYVTKL